MSPEIRRGIVVAFGALLLGSVLALWWLFFSVVEPQTILVALATVTLLCVLPLLGLSVLRFVRELHVPAPPSSSASRSEAEGGGIPASLEEKLGSLQKSFVALRNALDEKDAEIRRFKQGYDVHLLKKFALRFIRVDQAVDGFMRSERLDPQALRKIKLQLEDAFAEIDIEQFSPPVGGDYRNIEGLAENPEIQRTEKLEDKFKIVEVLEPGYRIKTTEGHEIVYPARVKIFTN